MIYKGSPAKHLPGLARLIPEKLHANLRCLYLNSPPMVAGIRSYLAAGGIDVAAEVEKGTLILTSDQSHLVNGRFDGDRMLQMLSDAVDQALRDGFAGLWATGDMAWELGSEKGLGKLLAYECGLEDLFRRQPALSGICQYHLDTLPARAAQVGVRVHPGVYINEMLWLLNPSYDPHTHPSSIIAPETDDEMRSLLRQQEC